jgi:hypothetical protein
MPTIEASRRNEQRKLTATWCNTVATGLLTVGVFAPVAALILGVRDTQANVTAVGLLLLVTPMVAIMLHLVGRRVLERIEE